MKKCAAEGLPVKNHMTALGPGLEATIREWFSDGQHSTTIETAERVDLKKVRVRRKKKVAVPVEESVAVEEAVAEARRLRLKKALRLRRRMLAQPWQRPRLSKHFLR